MNGIVEYIQGVTRLAPETQARLLTTAVIIAILILVRTVVLRFVPRDDPRVRYQWNKISAYVAAGLGIVLVGRLWFEGFHSLATFLGLLGAGLVLALRDVVANIAGWFFLMMRRPFAVGDRIQIGEYRGDVVDKRLFQFTLLEIGHWVDADQSTGRIVHVPNGRIFTEPLANYTGGFEYIWNEIPVRVSFESDWRAARDILLEIARAHGEQFTAAAEAKVREASKDYLILYSTFEPTVYVEVKHDAVVLTIRYLCKPRGRRNTVRAIWEEILGRFGQRDDISFAYPTTRYFYNAVEGKHGVRPAVAAGVRERPAPDGV